MSNSANYDGICKSHEVGALRDSKKIDIQLSGP